MTTYVPLRQRPIVAVRLKSDLMAARGDWVAIDPEENTVFQFTHEQFVALYGKRDALPVVKREPRTAPKKQPLPVTLVAPKDAVTEQADVPKTRTTNRTADSMLSSQLGRIFYHLHRSMTPVTLHELNEIIAGAENPNSVSAGLSSMKELELVRYLPATSARSGRWEVTDRGCVVFDRLGPVCFTKYNLQIPPDTLPVSLAEKLAAAWKDRHTP